MRGWKIALKGLSDTFEYLLPFTVATLAWWVSVLSVVLAPAATRALFRVADPRLPSALDRPSVAGSWRAPFRGARNAWVLTVVTLTPIVVLLSNLRLYTDGDARWTLLVPLWLILLAGCTLLALVAFSIASILDRPVGESIRLAAAISFGQPGRTGTMLLIAVPILLLSSVVVLPLFTVVPATVAAIVNRFVLVSLSFPIDDPLAPTDERETEEAIERSRAETARRFGP